MSKQTNAFQQLIHYIHEKIEGVDVTVTESAMIDEQNVDEKIAREVDILIEKTINGKNVRIAIECRDRESKDDIQWVDCLIGKYLNLAVQKVIAVSNSGYSKSAQLKAAANRIELKTLEEALTIDFNNEFIRIGMAAVSCNFKLEQFTFESSPPFKYKPNPQWKVFKDNNQIFTLDELRSNCIKKFVENFNQNFLKIFKTRADLNQLVLIENTIPINGLFVQSLDGEMHELLSLTVKMIGKPVVNEVEVRQRIYESALITEGKIDASELDKVHTLSVVQVAETNEGKLFIKSKKKKDKPKT